MYDKFKEAQSLAEKLGSVTEANFWNGHSIWGTKAEISGTLPDGGTFEITLVGAKKKETDDDRN